MTNNLLTLKLPPSDLDIEENRGDYAHGSNSARFLRTDWSYEQLLTFLRSGNEPMYGLWLDRVSQDTWSAVNKLLPGAKKELAAFKDQCEYEDVFTGRFTPSLLPLMLISLGFEQYTLEDGRKAHEVYEWAIEEEREMLASLKARKDEGNLTANLGLSRIEQVLLGTGHTKALLPSDGTVGVNWQFAELTNGDILVLAGYEWFNK